LRDAAVAAETLRRRGLWRAGVGDVQGLAGSVTAVVYVLIAIGVFGTLTVQR
jgi:hypothetical protein